SVLGIWEFQNMLYSSIFLNHDNSFNLNETNDLPLPESQYVLVNHSNQIEPEDDGSEATTNSDNTGVVIRPIISGASFLSWMSLEKSIEHYGKKNGFKPIKGWKNMGDKTGNRDSNPKH
ncbi:12404_t:CDS:1, partial [Racocetra fulgida]